MSKRTKTEQEDRGGNDSLTELIRTGARKLIAQALKAEVADWYCQLKSFWSKNRQLFIS